MKSQGPRILTALGALALATAAVAQSTDGTWSPAGDMSFARRDHTATRLNDGRVLIVGWFTDQAEVYDPVSAFFSTLASPTACGSHGQGFTATPLLDGRVLIVGGTMAPACAELFDPATETFTPTGSLSTGRNAHSATLLQDGRVLVAGGQGGSFNTFGSAEIYDPQAGVFVPTGSLVQARFSHAAVRLADGRALLTGGETTAGQPIGSAIALDSAEVYSPGPRRFRATGRLPEPRCCLFWTEARLLGNGKVLVLGGGLDRGALYDPTTGRFASTGPMQFARNAPSTASLPDGRVLVAGGNVLGEGGLNRTTESVETYDPRTNAFEVSPAMEEPRQQFPATPLSDGRVLVAGGANIYVWEESSSAELFTPGLRLALDVRPGVDPNTIRLSSLASLPVAILSGDGFDARSIAATSVRFGRTGSEAAPLRRSARDADGDGDIDVVYSFAPAQTGLQLGDTLAVLTGASTSGLAARGVDSVLVLR